MIRQILQNDLVFLKEIAREQFDDELVSILNIIDSFSDANYLFYGMQVDKKIVSFVIALSSLDDINILAVATKEEYKHNGYAERLIDRIIREKQDKTLSLEVKATNFPAKSLYQKLGFKTLSIRKKYYKDGTDAECMFLF